MHKRLHDQIVEARDPAGKLDFDRVCDLVSAPCALLDEARTRAERSAQTMLAEVEKLNRSRDATLTALQARNKQLDAALENMVHGLSLFDADNRLVIANRHYAEMYQLPPAVCVPGIHLIDLVEYALKAGILDDPRIMPGTLETLAAIPHAPVLERVWRLSSGRIIAFSISRLDDGGWVAVHKDVTDEVSAERRVAESEQRFRDFTATASDWCWETDQEHRFTFFSEGFKARTGIEPRVLLGRCILDMAVDEADKIVNEEHARILSKQNAFRNILIHMRAPKRRTLYIRASALPRFDKKGRFLGYRGTATDVTEEQKRKHLLEHTERLLKARTEQLSEAQRIGKLGDWHYRLSDHEIWWSPEMFELLRYDPAEFRPTRSAVLSIYGEESARRIMAVQSEVLRTGKVISVDAKIRRGDGTTGDFAVTSKALTGPEGRIVGFTGTVQDVSERKHAEAQLETLAYYDPLTGLANRVLFKQEVEDAITRCRTHQNGGALLLLDLDRFKEVNDSLGHAAGDDLLVAVARLISSAIGERAFLARLGGDEFALVVPECESSACAETLARRVIDILSEPITLESGDVSIGTSIGIALVPRDGASVDELLRNADLALYRAKEAGRGRFAFFEPEMGARLRERVALARDLRLAVNEESGLGVHYQPQVDFSTGRVSGYEALVRWRHPTLGNIPPSRFIPIAESSRLICDLGQWVLREAATQAKRWIDAGEPPREIAVNVSAAQIWHSDFVRDVERVLASTGLPPNLLCLELTESLMADHAEGRVRAVLGALKELGVVLALDDFGTNYSSLGYLTRLPFDKLKIDRIFIKGTAEAVRSRELLKGIIALGRGIGMPVIGEGAETPDEISILRQYGCDVVQGFALAGPVEASQALAFAHGLRIEEKGDSEPMPSERGLLAGVKTAA